MIWNFFGQSDRADFSVAETTSNSSLSSPTPIPHQSHTKNLRTDENIRAAELPIIQQQQQSQTFLSTAKTPGSPLAI